MTDTNRKQTQQTGQRSQDTEKSTPQTGQQQNTSMQNEEAEENPQSGSEWNNYRTRELSTNENVSPDDILSDE